MSIQALNSAAVAAPAFAPPQGGGAPQLSALPSQPPSGQSGPVAVAVTGRADVEQAVARVREQIQSISTNNLDFSIDDDSGKTVVRVTDRESGELIRQIPSQEMLEIARSIDRLQGLLVKQQA